MVGPSTFVEINGHKARILVAAKGAWQIADVDQFTSDNLGFYLLVDVTDGLREFYICPGDKLRSDVRKRHDDFVASKGGVRPKNPNSKHSAIYPEQVRKWRNGWSRVSK
ncbi:hypothetical protein [Nocardioides bizhenqiangii]|uniref:KTSC domain-containing protein n=1 Tax=Nocardioides bizhenqiangii TaxID=3095076 RepID=A0ABZ0ZTP3_9ACTN|nr:hypothetical protein [Nocardioides sp. HM61]WQQ27654.1 hypothetical protein SHK19_05315 [Nocardioides sp. HM61]